MDNHNEDYSNRVLWPHALIATSTHDSKRSEDVRARINVLSEIPEMWKECLKKWNQMNKKKRIIVDAQVVPNRNEEYFLYQTLLGAWPLGQMDVAEIEFFRKRIKDYMLKSLREAKVNTSWINSNTLYEDAVMMFIEAIMKDTDDNQFIKDFKAFQKMISHYGMYNSLSQTLLKIASPGVPDFYQGTEMWDFSLVDPDNRRSVDYGIRIRILDELKRREAEDVLPELTRELTVNKNNGEIKLYLIYKALNYRKEKRELFEKGEYITLETMGEKADNVCTFARRLGNLTTLVVAPRFFTRLIKKPDDLPFGMEVWKDSFIVVSFEETGVRYRNIFTGEMLTTKNYKDSTALLLSEIFAHFPAALLERVV